MRWRFHAGAWVCRYQATLLCPLVVYRQSLVREGYRRELCPYVFAYSQPPRETNLKARIILGSGFAQGQWPWAKSVSWTVACNLSLALS